MSAKISALWLVLPVASLVGLSAAEAQTVRFVSSHGKDTNSCVRSAPCRTLQRAHNVTPGGGEVQILDSGDYRMTLTIGKSITVSGIDSNATVGRIVVDNANAVVTLRRLLLNGTGLGGNGVLINSAKAVHIDDCDIERSGAAGIRLNNISAELYISNSVARDNGTSGLLVLGPARLTVDNSRFENNGDAGISVENNAKSSITRSVASGNTSQGIRQVGDQSGHMHVASTSVSKNVDGLFVTSGHMLLESVTAEDNQFNGLFIGVGASALISNSTFTDNLTGIFHQGVLATRNNNTVVVNTTNDKGAGAVNSFAPF